MLKALAKKMYEKGVTDEELLLQKFTALKTDRKDKQRKKLDRNDQDKVRDKVYNSNEMRKLWKQLLQYEPETGYHSVMLDQYAKSGIPFTKVRNQGSRDVSPVGKTKKR